LNKVHIILKLINNNKWKTGKSVKMPKGIFSTFSTLKLELPQQIDLLNLEESQPDPHCNLKA